MTGFASSGSVAGRPGKAALISTGAILGLAACSAAPV
jgi:hypothetical protein